MGHRVALPARPETGGLFVSGGGTYFNAESAEDPQRAQRYVFPAQPEKHSAKLCGDEVEGKGKSAGFEV